MMTVAITKSAAKNLRDLPADVRPAVEEAIASLAKYPAVEGVKALQGAFKGTYRVRVGNYRVVFTIAAGVVTVGRVADRRDVYR